MRRTGVDLFQWGGVLLLLMALPSAWLLLFSGQSPLSVAVLVTFMTLLIPWSGRLATGGVRVRQLRNYYGIYRVYDREGIRYLQHGTTQHGRQYLDPSRQGLPLAYYHPSTPAAEWMMTERDGLRHIGMIGLGAGGLTAYAHVGQHIRIFELDPDNFTIAEEDFSYLQQAREQGAVLSFVFGDGRVSLRMEPEASFDLIILDAFNSGSIPVHLLTVEALREYFRVLKPDGLLLMHVSNKVLNLEPVVYRNAMEVGAWACEKNNSGHVHPEAEITFWMALGREDSLLRQLRHQGWFVRSPESLPAPWSDRYCNVFGAMF